MIRVSNIELGLNDEENNLKQIIANKLNISDDEILSLNIFKKSLDARQKKIKFIYTVDIKAKNETDLLLYWNEKINPNSTKPSNSKLSISKIIEEKYSYPVKGKQKLNSNPVIIGAGPAGLFAGLILSEAGYNPIIFERGKSIENRIKDVEHFWLTGELNTESNVQFGLGGAGTFSDGKLQTQIRDSRIKKVLEEFVSAGASEEILYLNKPHIGTDCLQKIINNISSKIVDNRGIFIFNTKVKDLIIENNKVYGIKTEFGELKSDIVILAVGNSARDTFYMLAERGINIIPKDFAVGVRIEHHQDLINRALYKEYANHPKLKAAEYKLVYHSDKTNMSAYTFCMCPGGLVISSVSEENFITTNGMSFHNRAGQNANSAIVVPISLKNFGNKNPVAGIEFQRNWESKAFIAGGKNYFAPVQLLKDFLVGRESTGLGKIEPTYRPGIKLSDLNNCLPKYVCQTIKEAIIYFDKKIKGFADDDSVLTGIETKTSSPVRILRDENYQSNIQGLYPIGEGAGFAGGIISAAVDGIKAAEKIISVYSDSGAM